MAGKKNKYGEVLVLSLALIMASSWAIAVSPVLAEEGVLVSTEQATLDSAGRKDPFKPFIDTASDVMKKPKTKGALPLSPLQRQDLALFKLVGISGNDQDGWKAIVEDSEKKFYPLVEGTLIGLDQGRVSSIKSDRVIVAVKSADQKGKTNYISIMLHKDIEGTP
jgi:type IV pilus assembly protein PilP